MEAWRRGGGRGRCAGLRLGRRCKSCNKRRQISGAKRGHVARVILASYWLDCCVGGRDQAVGFRIAWKVGFSALRLVLPSRIGRYVATLLSRYKTFVPVVAEGAYKVGARVGFMACCISSSLCCVAHSLLRSEVLSRRNQPSFPGEEVQD